MRASNRNQRRCDYCKYVLALATQLLDSVTIPIETKRDLLLPAPGAARKGKRRRPRIARADRAAGGGASELDVRRT